MRTWGVDAATWGIRALLEDAGLRGPDGAPPSEALALVLAGGVGFGSVAAPPGSPVRWFVGGRHAWHADLAYITEACASIGFEIAQFESEDASVSTLILDQWLSVDAPCVLAWVDAAMLPWHALPSSWRGLSPRVVILRGKTPDGVLVEDVRAETHVLSTADLIAARAVLPRHRGRLIRLTDETQFVDMGGAIKRGVEACVMGLRKGHRDLSGHEALRAWAGYLVRADAFQERFSTPVDVMDALLDLHRRIEGQGALLRALFADGIGEASALLRDPVLREQRIVWAPIARDWSALAGRCLPSEPQLEALQHLGVQLDRAVAAGMPAEQLADKRARYEELHGELALSWMPPAHELDTLLTSLGHSLRELVHREEEAIDELAEWAGMDP